MSEELDIKRVCLLVRPGLEVWLDEQKGKQLGDDLINDRLGKFVRIESRIINTADIAGIFNPLELSEYRKRERGMWKCKYDYWHNKSENCECGRR